MDNFIETVSGVGIGFGLCENIRPDRDWIHIAHGVRITAAGLRYVIYAHATALEDPAWVIAEPVGT